MTLIVLIFAGIALLLLGMIYLQGKVFEGVRAYVRGEGLWAKSQKDAVLYLDRYSYSRSESDYEKFRSAVQANLGDRQARIALVKSPPDEAAAREGFITGRNQAEDVDSLIWFFVNFQFVSYMHEAIALWELADAKLDELILAGEAMRREAQSNGGRAGEIARMRDSLQYLNGDLMLLENRFSIVLGEGARKVRWALWTGSVAMFVLFLGFGAFVSRQIVRSIAKSEEQLRLAATVFASSSDGVLITDPAMAIVSANRTLCRMTGWPEDELMGKTPRIFQSGHTSADQYREMWSALNGRGVWQGDIVDRTRDGALLPVHISISAVRAAKGHVTHYVAIVSDIAERVEREERLRYLAHHDPLTGLPNRVLFNDRIEQAVKNAARSGKKFAVLVLDLDDFKPVNDRFGHQVGDGVLRLVAERLSGAIRATDTVTRLGGDEFVVLLMDVDSGLDFNDILNKVVAAASAPGEIEGHPIEIGISAGMGVFPDDGNDADALLRCADRAMYAMKNGGKSGRSKS